MNALKRKANDLEEKARALSDTKIIKSSLLVIALFVWVAIGTGFALSALDRRPIVDATFETTSALTTTGMSTGITTLDLGLPSKSLLIVNMIIGKFEIVALMYIFSDSIQRRLS